MATTLVTSNDENWSIPERYGGGTIPFRGSVAIGDTLANVMSAFGGDHRMQYSPFVHPVTANGVRCVVVDVRLEEIEPMAYRFLLSFAKDNELKVRDGRIEERTKLAELQRVGDTA